MKEVKKISSSRTRSGFNFLSPFYDFLAATFSFNRIFKSQIALLSEEKYNSVLLFGGGTGKLLMELMKRNIAQQYCYIDISDKMIARAKRKVKKHFPEKINSVEFIRGSYNDIPGKKFDAVFTPFILDCFSEEELSIVMKKLDEHLSENGKWYFSDFHIPAQKGKPVSKIIIRMLYFFFNIVCGLGIKKLPPFEEKFARLCYMTTKKKYFMKGMIQAKIYEKRY